MQGFDPKKLKLKGEVKKAYSINADTVEIYDYLSDIRMLLQHVPHVTKIQLRQNTHRARLFFNINVLAIPIDAVMDIEPHFNPEERHIQLTNPETSLGAIPGGFVTGNFFADLKIAPKETGHTKITSHLVLGFDAEQIDMLTMFSRSFIENTGQSLLQEYMDKTSMNYITNLVNHFPVWQKARKAALKSQ